MRIVDPIRKIVEFVVTDENEEISHFAHNCGDAFQWVVLMGGFDDDPRELIEIPEARHLGQRLIDLGILAVMVQPRPDGTRSHKAALDAIDLHCIARGVGSVRRQGKQVWTKQQVPMVEYFRDLRRSYIAAGAPPQSLVQLNELIKKFEIRFNPLDGTADFAMDAASDVEITRQKSGF
ncbi:MAG: hypothetical protein ACXAC5_02705 [Promethearchaeota archaeon]|jgi:hypothetical protein